MKCEQCSSEIETWGSSPDYKCDECGWIPELDFDDDREIY